MSEELEKLVLRGDLNFEQIVVLQIRRCLDTTHDSKLYSINVGHLLRMLPKALKDSKKFGVQLDKHTETKKRLIYKYSSGRPIGTPESPIYRNKKDDWNWDGGKPILVSPIIVKQDVTDWEGVFELCLDSCNELGIAWKKLSKGGAV